MIEHELYKEELSYLCNLQLPWEKLFCKKVLITGGTGLIGSMIADSLLYKNEMENCRIKISVIGRSFKSAVDKFGKYLDNGSLQFIECDISKPWQCNQKFDYIIHAAGKGDPHSFLTDPTGVMNANYIGMYQVLELARKSKSEKVVYLSSGEVYGNCMKWDLDSDITAGGISESDYGELDILNVRSCYASAKRAAETLCVSYKEQFGINVSIARISHTFGAGMLTDDNRVIGQFIRSAVRKEDIIMKSPGIQKRSYCYAADTAAGIFTIMLSGSSGEAYNVANKLSVMTIKELAEQIALNSGVNVIMDCVKEYSGYSDIMFAVFNTDKLEKLGWIPQFTCEEGIKRTKCMMYGKGERK